MTETWGGHDDRLRSLALLEPGWADGAGERINLDAIQAAWAVLARLPQPEWNAWGVFPTEAGGVLVEYLHLDLNVTSVTSIEIEPDGAIEIHGLALRAGPEAHEPVTESTTTRSPEEAAGLAVQIRTRTTAAVTGGSLTAWQA